MAGDFVWKPRTIEDSVDAGVHPAVAAMRLNGGEKPQLDLGRLGIDPSRADWGSNRVGTALMENLGFMRALKPDTPQWALAEEGLVPKQKEVAEKKSKKEKKEKKKSKKEKKKKKKKKDKKAKDSSSSSGSSSSSSSSGKKTKKKKRREESPEANATQAPASSGQTQQVTEEPVPPPAKRAETEESSAQGASEPAVPEAAPAASAETEGSPFPRVLECLERHDLTILEEAIGLLLPGAHPEPQRAAIAGALGSLVKASVDPTGINRVAVARAGAIPPLVQLLKSMFSECQLQAAWALHNLTSKNADNKEAVVREGGVTPLLAVLRSGTPEAKSQAVGVLRNLSGGSIACKAALEAAGAIQTVVHLLTKAGVFQPQVQANLAVILYNLCKDAPDCKLQVVKGGALQVLVSLLGSGVPQAQQEAADTLRIVAVGNAEYSAAAVAAGVLPVLGVAMGPTATPKVRQQASLLKKELAKNGALK